MSKPETILNRSNVKNPQRTGDRKTKAPFFTPKHIQPKLTIGPVDDPLEKEADAIADQVMRMTNPDTIQTQSSPITIQPKCAACEQEELRRKEEDDEEQPIQLKAIHDFPVQRKCAECEEEEHLQLKPFAAQNIQRKCEHCEEEEEAIQLKQNTTLPVQRKCAACEAEEQLQRKENGVSTVPSVPTSVYTTIQSIGHPIDHHTRSFMESRFHYDFSKVQIHNNKQAHQSSAAIHALAYTRGEHIVFAEGQYQPQTYTGKQLLAHELTHVVQQSGERLTPAVQRQKGDEKTEPEIENDPEDEIDFKLTWAKTFTQAERAVIIKGEFLDVFDVKNNSDLGAFTIHINPQKVAEFFSIKYAEILLADKPFVVFGFDTKIFRIKPTINYERENGSSFTTQELNEVFFNVPNWFSSTDDEAQFQALVGGKPTVLFVSQIQYKSLPVDKTKKPVPQKWMTDFKKGFQEYIEKQKEQDPVSIDMPDKTELFYYEKEGQWKIRAVQKDSRKKTTHVVFVDLKKGATKEASLEKIRMAIRQEIVKEDKNAVTIDGTQHTLPSKFAWVKDWLAKLEKLIAADRQKTRGLVDNLPDKLSLSGSAAEPDSIFLTISVFVENKATLSDVQQTGKDIEQIKKRSDDVWYTPMVGVTLQSGTIPIALVPTMPPEEFLPVVRKYSYALRHGVTEVKPEDKTLQDKYERILQPYPSSIKPLNVRPDFQTVPGASQKFRMVIDTTSVEGNNPVATLVFFNPVHYTWRMYSVNDLFDQPKDLEAFSLDWETRRIQLMQYFKSKQDIKIKPLLNTKAMAANKKLLEQAFYPAPLPEGAVKDVYYGDSGLDADGEFTLPDKTGDYLVYCSAQTEPFGNTIQIPSEAFFPIRIREGYELASETLEQYRDPQIKKLEDAIAAEKNEEKKKELQQQLKKLTSRTLRDLTDPTKPGNKVADLDEGIRIASKLNALFKTWYIGDELEFELKIAEDKKDYEALIGLWYKMKRLSGNTPDNLQKYIDQLTQSKKGVGELHERITDFNDVIDYTKPVYTPNIVLISDETGQEYQLITILAYSKEPPFMGDRSRVILVDVSTEDTKKKYYSDDFTDKVDEDNFISLAQQAFEDFAGTCKYGEGYIVYAVPGLPSLKGRLSGECSTGQKVKNVLGKLALVAGIAALVLGTIASGGVLGGVAVALGVGSAVIGAGLSLYNISDRVSNHRFHADIEFALDVINIIAPFSMGAMAITRGAKLGLITEGIENIEALSKLKGLVRLEQGIAFYQKFEMSTNFILTNYKLCEDLDKINKMNISDEEKDVLRRRLLYNGLLANFMFGASLSHEFSPETASNKRLNDLILATGKPELYTNANVKDGLYNADGTFNENIGKPAEKPASPVEEPTATSKEHEAPPPSESVPAEGGKQKPDSYEKKRNIDMEGHTKSVDGAHELEVYKDGSIGICSPAAPGAKCRSLALEYGNVLASRPGLRTELQELYRSIGQHETVPQSLLDQLALMEQRLRLLQQVQATSIAPKGWPILEVTHDNYPYPPPREVIIEFPEGQRVWVTADGRVITEYELAPSIGTANRRGTEEVLPPQPAGMQRGHQGAPGTGFESPYGITGNLTEINQQVQNFGIEGFLRRVQQGRPRRFRNISPGRFKIISESSAYPGSTDLEFIRYRIDAISQDGLQTRRMFSFRVNQEQNPLANRQITIDEIEVNAPEFLDIADLAATLTRLFRNIQPPVRILTD